MLAKKEATRLLEWLLSNPKPTQLFATTDQVERKRQAHAQKSDGRRFGHRHQDSIIKINSYPLPFGRYP